MRKLSEEDKAAKKLIDIVSDIRLDLDEIGYQFAKNVGSVLYNRFVVIADSAEEEKENQNGRNIIR